MNEQQMEALEKMFPNGFVIVTKPSLNKIFIKLWNPKESETLESMYHAAHDEWKSMEASTEDDE